MFNVSLEVFFHFPTNQASLPFAQEQPTVEAHLRACSLMDLILNLAFLQGVQSAISGRLLSHVSSSPELLPFIDNMPFHTGRSFSTSAPLTSGLDSSFSWRSVLCITGPLAVSLASTYWVPLLRLETTKNVSRCCQMFLGIKSPKTENSWPKISQKGKMRVADS